MSKKVWSERCREWPGDGFLVASVGKNPSSEAGAPGIESEPAVSFSVYVHVPYCLRRCGYCDFNTYANLDLRPGVAGYADAVGREISLVVRLFSGSFGSVHEAPAEMAPPAAGATPTTRGTDPNEAPEIPGGRVIDTVFFGRGTPTVLPPEDLVQIFYALKDIFGVCPGAEITTEANPDTVDAGYLEELVVGGFMRAPFGMQSTVSGVLRVLDRIHAQANLGAAVRAAQSLGSECSVDLIYGAPGESMADWRESLEVALALGMSHVSYYALSIEPATALGRELCWERISPVDPDDQAEKYEIADWVLNATGLQWYEISNWARSGHECRHSLAYWRNRDYYGFGPGAHSHLRGEHWGRGRVPAGDFPGGGGQDCKHDRGLAEGFPPTGSRRFWNLKHPACRAVAVDAGRLPIEGGETVTGESLELEELPLGLWLRDGLGLREYAWKYGSGIAAGTRKVHRSAVSEGSRLAPHEFETKLLAEAQRLAAEGLLEAEPLGYNPGGNLGEDPREDPRAVLTRRGRLLTDTVIQRLTGV